MTYDPFIGTWRLLSYEIRRADGEIKYPWGQDPVGLLIYSGDGYISVAMMSANRPKFVDKDVKKGIDTLRSNKIFITKDSINLLKEIKTYSWKQKDDKSLDEPIKDNDHLMDAMRYAVHSHINKVEPRVRFI